VITASDMNLMRHELAHVTAAHQRGCRTSFISLNSDGGLITHSLWPDDANHADQRYAIAAGLAWRAGLNVSDDEEQLRDLPAAARNELVARAHTEVVPLVAAVPSATIYAMCETLNDCGRLVVEGEP
jgi:hypothetical protein